MSKSYELNQEFWNLQNKALPQQGSLLISDPFSQDSLFKRSVVLLTEHNHEGTIGFILNKPVEVKLNEIITSFPAFDATISIGGPVANDSLYFIHSLGSKIPNSQQITENVFWGGSFEILRLLIETNSIKKHEVRFFIGYSGWKSKQLDEELTNKYWIVTPHVPKGINLMTDSNEDIWRIAVDSMGKRLKMWRNVPENPLFN